MSNYENARYIEVAAEVRYWEDAELDGIPDDDGLIPLRRGKEWCPVIELATGRVLDWPEGMEADIHYKVCDQGEYWLLDKARARIAKWRGYYVPNRFLCHGGNGYGDYIIFKIGGDGLIAGWRNPDVDPDEWDDSASGRAQRTTIDNENCRSAPVPGTGIPTSGWASTESIVDADGLPRLMANVITSSGHPETLGALYDFINDWASRRAPVSTTPTPGAVEKAGFVLVGYQYGDTFTPVDEADDFMRGEGRELFAPSHPSEAKAGTIAGFQVVVDPWMPPDEVRLQSGEQSVTARHVGAKAGEACAHCKRLPSDPEYCDWAECPAGAAPAHPGEQKD